VKTRPIVAAAVDFSDRAAPRLLAADADNPSRGSAAAQARQIFLHGNGLPQRWRGRTRFCVLATGFGLGHDFLASWAAWRDDPARCERLFFIAMAPHPPSAADLARAHATSPLAPLARQLSAAWPALTCNLHLLDFAAGRVRLLLAFGDAQTWARELVARVDAFYLDGGMPEGDATTQQRSVWSMLARLAAPGATAVSPSRAAGVRAGLQGAGFAVQAAPGPEGGPDFTLARFAPRFSAPAPPGRVLPAQAPSHALVLGGGLAGAASARALAQQGIACTVIERHAAPAAEASGNPAGLFHGAVMGHDGPHARLHRAAALAATHTMRAALARGVAGRAEGLLRLEKRLSWPAMQALLERQALPRDYVQALPAAAASVAAGVDLAWPAWFYPGGGWIDPAALVRNALSTPGVTWQGQTRVERIAHHGDAWRLFNDAGRAVAEAPLLVLANAADALRLSDLPPAWLQRRRGQVSWSDGALLPRVPKMPLASGGYLLRLPDGRLLFGATSQIDDDAPQVREDDHRDNLAKATQLLGQVFLRDDAALQGRVGWRASTPDRLPLVGPAPDLAAQRPARCDAPRLLPRQAGLWLHSGLGSRGLSTATLNAELIAAWASGAPLPLEADLVDAVDPARWLLRRS
jgi:tRNA 5-methylaminomethyl-2-thiouridine biosynthesis bifunctional protein